MRMAELSEESGVPVATIRYYLREGLVPAGEHTSPNQARYNDSHVRRLKLVRALLEVGGLSITEVRRVVLAIDSEASTLDILDVAHTSLIIPKAEGSQEDRAWAVGLLEQTAERVGWVIVPDDKSTQALIGLLCTFRTIGHDAMLDDLERYAGLAAQMAELDLAALRTPTAPDSIVERAIVGTVLGDALFSALRRLAQQNEAKRLYGAE
jgi:DNA-binding transcriptional MerR regulator